MTKNILTVLTVVGLTTTMIPAESWGASGSYTPAPSTSSVSPSSSQHQSTDNLEALEKDIMIAANNAGKGKEFSRALEDAKRSFKRRTGALTCRSSKANPTSSNNYGARMVQCLTLQNQKMTANSKVAYRLLKGWQQKIKEAPAKICAMAALPLHIPGDKINLIRKKYSATNLGIQLENLRSACRNDSNWK